MKEIRVTLGVAIALSGVVYGLTDPYIQAYFLPPETAAVLPRKSFLYTFIWIGFFLYLGTTIPRYGHALHVVLRNAVLWLVAALVVRAVPAILWGGSSPGELAWYFSFGLFQAPPKIAPWYVYVGHLLGLAIIVVGEVLLPFFAFKEFFLGYVPQGTPSRGRALLDFGGAYRRAEAEREKESGPTLLWGWLELPWSFATKHFVACGSTGSGKTTLIRFLMQSVIPRIGRLPDERALVYDAKQDILSILHGMNLGSKPILLNPFDARSAAWDIAADVTEPSTAQQIATIFIPEEENASQRFFSDASRHLLAGVMRRFIKTAPGKWTLSDVVYAMLDQSRIEMILGGDPETVSLLTYLRDARTGNSVLSTVLTKMQPYEFIAAAWSRAEEKISLRKWVKGNVILILGNDEAQRSALDAINRAIFKRIVELVLAQENSTTRRTWFFLDEVREAGTLDGLQSLLTKGRSKGASVVLGFQDIDGMKEVYGEYLASEITGQCACKAFLRTDSPKTAQWASSILGDREYVELSHSESENQSSSTGFRGLPNKSAGTSKSVSQQIVKRPIVLDSEIMGLPLPGGDGKGPLNGYFVTPNVGAYFASIEWEWIEMNLAPTSNVQNLVKRDAAHEQLRSWAPTDFHRLGIGSEVSAHDVQVEKVNSKKDAQKETSAVDVTLLREAALRIRER